MKKFEDLGLNKSILNTIKNLGFQNPTQIQELSIPFIVKGGDIIGESATGSGKTLAFGCSIVEHVVHKQGLQALVITPTRELAEQVKEELRRMSKDKYLKVIAVYGGVAIGPQIHGLVTADVVVATPGRLLDHLGRRTIDMSNIKILVMDEADRMFDMGFIDDVEEIIKTCPKKRQTLFFSATISSKIKNLANKYMHDPKNVSARRYVDPSKLKQVYCDIPRGLKISLLVHLLEKEKSGLVMVFCNTRKNADFVARSLKANGINAIAIHGGLTQNKRSRTLEMFNDAKVGVLVCTDVAARGLHIENVSHVYNYDIPKNPNDYVHRIGRTARVGEEGKVLNILCDIDYDNFARIQSEYRNFTIKRTEIPYLKRAVAIKVETRRGPRGSRGRGPRRHVYQSMRR